MKPLLLALLLAQAGHLHAEHAIGSTPADFSGTPTRPQEFGNNWSLSDHQGKVVLVNFGAIW